MSDRVAFADSAPFAPGEAPGRRVEAPAPRSGPATRTISRGLTTRGRCLVAGGIAAAVCGVLLDERDLLRAGLLAIALPVVALLVTISRRATFVATHRAVPSRLARGTVGTVELRIRNAGRHRSSPTAVSDAPTPGISSGVRGTIPSLKRGASAVIRYRLHARRRGRFTIGGVEITHADPFGLCRRTRLLESRVSVLVLPVIVPLLGAPPSVGSRSAAGGATQGGTAGGDPDARVRRYAPGDDVRTIHWRATARRDELVVRTRESVSHGGAAVLLDHRAATHRGRGSSSSLEIAVSLAASISTHLLEDDVQLRLLTHDGRLLAAGNDVADDVLIALAEVTADRGTGTRPDSSGIALSSGDLRPGPLGDVGLVYAVLGAINSADAHRLDAQKPRGARGIAFVVEDRSWPVLAAGDTEDSGIPAGRHAHGTSAPRVPGAAALAAAGWRVVSISPDAEISALWRQACGAVPAAGAAAEAGTFPGTRHRVDEATPRTGMVDGVRPVR